MKKKYKIYFLEPNFAQFERPSFDEFMEPLNLCYLAAAAIKDGHDVFVKQQFNTSDEDIVSEIIEYNPDILAITIITLFFNRAKKLATLMKNCNPGIISIVGGPHVSGDPKGTAKHFDYIVVGEGEETFLSLLSHMPLKDNNSIPGVGHIFKKKFYFNNHRVRSNHIIKFPFRESLDFTKYTGIGNGPPPIPIVGFASMIASKGCRFNCNFCVNKTIWKDSFGSIPVIKRDPTDIVNEMLLLKHVYNIGYIWFQDSDFPLYDRLFMKKLFDEKRNVNTLKYSFMTRIENVIQGRNIAEAENFLTALKQSGCHMIGFGLESFSQPLLKQMNKITNFEKVKKTLELVFNAGIIPVAFFIIGYPDETIQRIEQTFEIAKTLKILRYRFAIFYPFKGSVITKKIKNEDWLVAEEESFDIADNEHQVIKSNVPFGKTVDYFNYMNSQIYFENEYKRTMDEFYENNLDLRPTIDNWGDFINHNFKAENNV